LDVAVKLPIQVAGPTIGHLPRLVPSTRVVTQDIVVSSQLAIGPRLDVQYLELDSFACLESIGSDVCRGTRGVVRQIRGHDGQQLTGFQRLGHQPTVAESLHARPSLARATEESMSSKTRKTGTAEPALPNIDGILNGILGGYDCRTMIASAHQPKEGPADLGDDVWASRKSTFPVSTPIK
jgi:hypothetical protein